MPANQGAYAITTHPQSEMASECPICYSAVADIIVCEHSHALCSDCYGRMLRDARSQNKKCAECREPMFQWNDGTQDPVVADRRAIVAPADAPLLQEGLTYEQARVRASWIFYFLTDTGVRSATRNAQIRHNFPILWTGGGGRQTFRCLARTSAQLAPYVIGAGGGITFQDPGAIPMPAPRPRRCGRCRQTGHIRTSLQCPLHPRNR